MATVAILLVGLMPAGRFKNTLLRILSRGWSVDRTARVHPVLLWGVGILRLGAHAYIGPGNVFRDIRLVDLGEGASIGQFNWFSAAAQGVAAADESLRASLVMEPHSGFTSRHYVDCSGGVLLGRATLIAGVRSTILSHSMNPHTWRQEALPVRVGPSTVVFTNVVITAGSTLAPDCLVGAGAVVASNLSVPGRFYGGVPAKEIADVSSSAYAGRETNRGAPRPGMRAILATGRQQSP